MNLKSHIVTLKGKTGLLKAISMLSALLLLILPINLTASAVTVEDSYNGTVVVLPFPSPDSFGDNSRSIVLKRDDTGQYFMYVLIFNPSSGISADSVDFNISMNHDISVSSSHGFVLEASLVTPTSSGDSFPEFSSESNVEAHLYAFIYTPNNSYYSCSKLDTRLSPSNNISFYITSNEPLYFKYSNSSAVFNDSFVRNFSGSRFSHSSGSIYGSNITYTFSNDASGFLLSEITKQFQQTNFYLNEILNSLKDGESYTPSETTSNKDMSDYDSAEGALMDNNISALNNLQLPDLNSFNSGKQGNAFQFISSNIEFFSGMNGSGSIAKVGSVLLVVLGLGLTSFIIGLSNRKKGG